MAVIALSPPNTWLFIILIINKLQIKLNYEKLENIYIYIQNYLKLIYEIIQNYKKK